MFALISGCTMQPTKSPEARTAVLIDSEPQGASVRVSGKLIGVTPVKANIDDVFPMHWTSRVETDEEGFAFYRRMEMVEISKEGCELYSKRYMDKDLLTDTRVTLKCDPNYKAPAVAEDGVEQRLRKLDELRGKGLISDEELREQRQRILNTL